MKCEAQIKITGKEDKDFQEILFNPNSDNPVVSIIGEKTFRMFELKENIEEKTFVIEEVEEKGMADFTHKYTIRAHHYLNCSPHIAILADEVTLVIDYKGVVVQKIDEVGTCLSNWAEGFLIGGQNIKFLRYEEGTYKVKGHFELS